MIKPLINFQPYNEMWLDCVANNLMAILIYEDESLSSLPIKFKVQYWKKKDNQKFSSYETYQNLQEQGLFIPKVIYDNDELYSFFNISKMIIEPNDSDDVHIIIKEALSRGQFVFIHMDRFFYKSGRESGKIHLVHPTFIYGYCDNDKNYIGFEDCISPGRMHPYKIPYEVIDLSLQHFKANNKNIEYQLVSLKSKEVRYYNLDLSNQSRCEIIDHYNTSKVIYHKEFDLYYQVGIAALYEYVEELEEILLRLNDPSIFLLRTNSFIHNHQRNSLLIDYLYSNGVNNNNLYIEIMENLNMLISSWVMQKNFTLKRLQTKNGNHSIELKKNLLSIINMEEKFLGHLMKCI